MPKKTIQERFREKVDTTNLSGCWNWKGSKDRQGYGQIIIDGKAYKAHRLSVMLVRGDIPKGYVVMHKCDNPSCCRPSHLTVGTYQDNAQDKIKKGRQGAKFSNLTKLTKQEISEIGVLLAEGRACSIIAERYKVSRSTIFCIERNKTWVHQ